jgi:hypothetical protein
MMMSLRAAEELAASPSGPAKHTFTYLIMIVSIRQYRRNLENLLQVGKQNALELFVTHSTETNMTTKADAATTTTLVQ